MKEITVILIILAMPNSCLKVMIMAITKISFLLFRNK